MKSYNQFVGEAYSARENLQEFLGIGRLVGKGIKAVGSKGFKFSKYAGRRGFGAASAGYAAAKGDLIGTGLGIAGMLPGAPGLLALGAQAVRSLRGDYRNNQPKEDEKETVTPSQSDDNTIQPTPPPEKPKSVEDISKGIDDTIKQIEKSREKWKTNPSQPQQPKLQEPKQEKKKRTIKDIRDRDINARGSYDPRYDR